MTDNDVHDFKVEIEHETRLGMRVWDLSVTNNGYQWHTIRLYSLEEIQRVIQALMDEML